MPALAADVWSHWSLLRALGSPAVLAEEIRRAGYDAWLLADRHSLAGVFEAGVAADEQGLRLLVGVTTELTTPSGPIPIRVVALTGEAWSLLARAASDDPLPLEAVLRQDVAILLPEAEFWVGASWVDAVVTSTGGAYYLTARPDSTTLSGVAPLAARPIRFPTARDVEAYRVLRAIGGEQPAPDAGWVRPAADWVSLMGAGHPALKSWDDLVARAGSRVWPPGEPKLPAWPDAPPPAWPEVLARQAAAGLRARFRGTSPEPYRRRLAEELRQIRSLGFDAYFLIVADLVAWARQQGIAVGPGRGSAAASLVAWVLGITEVDPLRWGLVFERFLNPHRRNLPDIDLDVEDSRRSLLLPYLEERYGPERVGQIGTFGTLGARAALRDSGRVLAHDPALVDRLARLIPAEPGITLAEAAKAVPPLADALRRPDIRAWWEIARRLEGAPRHQSVHAAGVVIAPGPLRAWVPVRTENGHQVTGLSMQDIERLGLLKLDLLGLRTLSVVRRAVELAGVPVPPLTAVPEDDPDTLALLGAGETEAVFQLDGRGVKDLLHRLKPRHVEDVMLAIALFRPGPMEQIGEFLKRRRGAPIPDDAWHRLLSATHGILVYQEQLMAVARELAGYSWAEADLFRRAVSKKDRDLLESERQRFLARATARGFAPADAAAIWERIRAFADYGFNQAHATAYGLLAYYEAFLKAHWPLAFWAAELGSLGHGARLGQGVKAAFQEGLDVYGPDLNRSGADPVPEGGGVRLGLNAVRGLGQAVVAAILEERAARGPFVDGDDVWKRLGRVLSEAVWTQLEAAGALSALPPTRTRTRQLDWFADNETDKRWAVDEMAGLGFRIPRWDGMIYVRVEAVDDHLRQALAAVSVRHPGPGRVVLTVAGERQGRRVGIGLAGDLAALRAVRRIPGVAAVARGTDEGEATTSGGKRES